jgi:hypothetical protein
MNDNIEPPQPTDADGPEIFEAHAAWVKGAAPAVPMAFPTADAPQDGRWLLGYVPSRAEHGRGWCLIAWGDSGWHDDAWNEVGPDLCALLPDPQPKHTGWQPPAGRIRLTELSSDGWTDGEGNPISAPWRWMIDIERPDGTYDKYRDNDMRVTREEGERCALKWQEKFGLPIVIEELDRKVLQFRPPVTRQ